MLTRLYNMDYLRGLATFGIMISHYLNWTFGKFSADTLTYRFGICIVSVFYILSGLTLYYVYYDKMIPSKDDILAYYRKRVFRIFPLLWIVTIIALVLSKQMPDFYNLFLNLSGLFGFIKWDTYFSSGVWAIGNELVFYTLFPFFILFTKSHKSLMIFLVLISFCLYLYFSFILLKQELTLSDQWRNFVNPLNHIFLFLGGFLIGLFLFNTTIKNSIIITILTIGLSLIIFYPVKGDAIYLVTGVNRLIFTACSFLICISFYKMTFTLPKFIHKPLTLLGEASYSVYLLHPIVYSVTGITLAFSSKHLFHSSEPVRIIISVISTLIISYFVFQYFEKFFINLGRTKMNSTICCKR